MSKVKQLRLMLVACDFTLALSFLFLLAIGFQYFQTMDEIEQMRKIDQDLIAHSVIPYWSPNYSE